MPVGDDDTIAGAAAAHGAEPPDVVAGRYRIVRWLGGGGMGRVYEAQDTELGERVALKILRDGLSSDAIERFRREVRLTRRIQHPNVARMFDIGEHGGLRFLTMELIDGPSLGRSIGHVLPWPRLLLIGRQLCAGLAAAHDKGVVHRDLKPDNVLLERATDRAVITDFGIARGSDDATVTQVGSVVGTPRYMAPEQLGGGEVDVRSDLFSLGVILYELATGSRPWHGENAVTIAIAQVTQPAQPIAAASLPAGFVELVTRCLEVDPTRRPATARELGERLDEMDPDHGQPRTAELRTPRRDPAGPKSLDASLVDRPRRPSMSGMDTRAGSTAPHRIATTLAVLPITCAPGDEYLADGVLEDLIDTLSTTAGLRVRPAGMVRPVTDPDPREVGRKLEVDHVVCGSLRRTPQGVRVSARLIGAADGFQIWAHRADGGECDILAISEQLAHGIAEALSTRATGPTRPTDPRAVELYLRARAERRLFWATHLKLAADLLDQAFEISPSSAPIAGARALAATQAWVMSGEPQLAPRAREAIERGLASGHPEAFLASASYKLNTNDAIGGAADLGVALLRAPMLAAAHEMVGRVLVEVDAASEARQHFDTARALDPTRAHILATDLARLDALEGHWDRADETLGTLLADADPAIRQLGAIYRARLATWRGDRAAMLEAATVFAPRMGNQTSRLIDYIHEVAASGTLEPDAWREFLIRFGGPDVPHRNQLIGLQVLAELALMIGDHALAYDTLEEADQLGLIDVFVLDRCPVFRPLTGERRFVTLRDRVRTRAGKVLAAFRSTSG
jgi:eukaryotic-like serine/threonine-protein kinase